MIDFALLHSSVLSIQLDGGCGCVGIMHLVDVAMLHQIKKHFNQNDNTSLRQMHHILPEAKIIIMINC